MFVCAGCHRPLPDIGLAPGSVVAGRYEILEGLGEGGMARVYKAHDHALDLKVALKVLKASRSRDASLAQRFRSEIKLAWKVRHRCVCGIHEYGEDGEILYISMELVAGPDLRRLLSEKGAFAWEQAYDVAVQITEGLQAIHEAGVVHRDLKPANITLDERGLVRVMDFGIAKVWGEESGGLTSTGHVVGSPAYMSPEQIEGGRVDFRSDLYSLGLVIYELFTGRLLFKAGTPAAVLRRRLESDEHWKGAAGLAIPTAALPILRKTLAREAERRYASCSELLRELRSARAQLATQKTDAPAESVSSQGVMPAGPAQLLASRRARDARAKLLRAPLSRAILHADGAVRQAAAEALERLADDAGRGEAGAAPASLATSSLDSDRIALSDPPAPPLPLHPPAPLRQVPVRPSRHETTSSAEGAAPPARAPRRLWRMGVLVGVPASVGLLAIATIRILLGGSEAGRAIEDPIQRSSPRTLPAPLPPSTTPEPSPEAVDEALPTAAPPAPSRMAPRPSPSAPARQPVAPITMAPAVSAPFASPSPEGEVPGEFAPSPPIASITPPEPIEASASPTTLAPAPAPPLPTFKPACVDCPIPEAARILQARLRLTRTVSLKLHVSESGAVETAEWLEGPAELRGAILDAARRWRCRPGRVGDTPVRAELVYAIRFE